MIPSLRYGEYSEKNHFLHAAVAALAAALFFVIFLIVCGIVPFGERSWTVLDMKMQYLDFYSYYKTVLAGKNDLFYAPAMTLGSGAIGFFSYYLSSPLLLLLAFFKRTQLPAAVTLLTGIKCMFTAASCEFMLSDYIRKRSERKDRMPFTLPFSLAYAFCACIVTYTVNPMWLEVFALMPLVLWALERLIREKKIFAYVLSLALMIWCNYYIAYMVCLFIILWTLHLLAEEPEGWFPKLCRVAGCSLLAVCLDAVALVPTVFGLSGSPKDAEAAVSGGSARLLDLRLLFSKSWFMAFDADQTWWGVPLLYAGIAVLLLLFLYFADKKIPRRERISMALILLFFLLSFLLRPLDLLWHAGMVPSGYPYREAFLFAFTAVLCAAREFDAAGGLEGKLRLIVAAILAAGLLFVSTRGEVFADRRMLLMNILLILAWTLLFLLQGFARKKGEALRFRGIPLMLFCLLMAGELLVNAVYIFRVQTSSGMLAYSDYQSIVRSTEEELKLLPAEGVYRVENMAAREQNDGMMFDYSSLSHYSSAGQMEIRHFLQELGYNDDGLAVTYGSDNTCTAESLLGIAYLLSAERRPEYEVLGEGDNGTVKNPYALPLALAVDEMPDCEHGDPFAMQQSLLSSLSGCEDKLFVPLSVTEKKGEDEVVYSCEAQVDGHVYLYLAGIADRIQNLAIEKDGEFLSGYGNKACMKVLNLGRFNEGERFSLRIRGDGEAFDPGRLCLVTEDTAALRRAARDAFDGASGRKGADLKQPRSSVYEITMPSAAQGLFMSIPYEGSWVAEAEGVNLKTLRCCGALLYVDTEGVEAGSVIRLRYVPKGLYAGMVVSLLSLVILALVSGFLRKKEQKPEASALR
ncbi:MAG: YfhO family protein [Lachnospiraceae bacterium]|nr:YfhO family protein [Lachnospiraceae bacterium]